MHLQGHQKHVLAEATPSERQVLRHKGWEALSMLAWYVASFARWILYQERFLQPCFRLFVLSVLHSYSLNKQATDCFEMTPSPPRYSLVLPLPLLLLPLSHSSFAFAILNTCFLPNGTDNNAIQNGETNNYIPCQNYAGVHSMCCHVGDVCTTNGLCTNDNGFWRDCCTDPTWRDPHCNKLFIKEAGKPCQLEQCLRKSVSD